jgi:hypothetical protein
LDQIRLDILVDDWLGGLDAKDVAGNLVAELDPASLKSEEGGVAALLLRSLELNGDLEGGTSDDLILQGDNLGLHVVAGCLQELSARRPGCLSIVAHPPGLAENVSADDLVLVREALLDETSRVTHVLGFWCLSFPSVSFLLGSSWLKLLARGHHLPLVLADQLLGSL